ncbi:MAG: hypothetical protein DSY46_03710 [Hydrogenimonas sp.]|nr:MAG: hypothetical protein DSY46_03710 [Hydrogenimonas sp.]
MKEIVEEEESLCETISDAPGMVEEIQEDLSEEEFQAWKDEITFDKKQSVAEYYTKIYEKRFEASYEAGYEELQRYINQAEPSVGYAFLAQFLSETPNKFVITTNFDTMIEDALFDFLKEKPLILGHESLSKYLKITSTRPTIIKIHRDMFFEPYNRDGEVKRLAEAWEKALTPILRQNAMIVIGYGGNDNSLMDYLESIEERKPIYWCYRPEDGIPPKAIDLLTNNDYVVPIKGFDEFMLMLSDKLQFKPMVNQKKIEESLIVERAIEYAKKHVEQLEKLYKTLDLQGKEALTKILPNWWAYEVEVDKTDDPDEKDRIYQEGLKAYPKSHELMGNYATFLKNIRKDYDQAEKYYKKAIETDPNDADYLGNYAIFLHHIRKDYDQAEKYYKKAIEANPKHAIHLSNYAQFLLATGNKEKGEKYLERAFNALDETDHPLALELWFYRLAHFPSYRQTAQAELDRLLEMGYRSIEWDFTPNIERAIADGFDDPGLLKRYAERISEEKHDV